jgi:hypothetical protein
MPLLYVLGILFVWLLAWLKEKLTPPDPPINDWDRFVKESRTMTKDEIRRGLRKGRWS